MATNDELISEMLHENARLARLKAAAGVSLYDKDTSKDGSAEDGPIVIDFAESQGKCVEELEAWAERNRLQLLAPEGLNCVLGSGGKSIN